MPSGANDACVGSNSGATPSMHHRQVQRGLWDLVRIYRVSDPITNAARIDSFQFRTIEAERSRLSSQGMTAYSFLTTWCVDAPIERVWEVIYASEHYPRWWKGVRNVTELEPSDESGVGGLSRFEWRSKLPYSLEFDLRVTRCERPYLLEAHASGELEGIGVWRLYEGRAGTALVYSWKVSTTRRWMNRLAPMLRPAFVWNQDHAMRQGAQGLADELGAPLVAFG